MNGRHNAISVVAQVSTELCKLSRKQRHTLTEVAAIMAYIDVLRVAYTELLHTCEPKNRKALEKAAYDYYFGSLLQKYFPQEHDRYLRVKRAKKSSAHDD